MHGGPIEHPTRLQKFVEKHVFEMEETSELFWLFLKSLVSVENRLVWRMHTSTTFRSAPGGKRFSNALGFRLMEPSFV